MMNHSAYTDRPTSLFLQEQALHLNVDAAHKLQNNPVATRQEIPTGLVACVEEPSALHSILCYQ